MTRRFACPFPLPVMFQLSEYVLEPHIGPLHELLSLLATSDGPCMASVL